MLDIFEDNLNILKISRVSIRTDLELTDTQLGLSLNTGNTTETIEIPSGRVTRAEIWLTGYRSLYINFDAKFLVIQHPVNKSACEF